MTGVSETAPRVPVFRAPGRHPATDRSIVAAAGLLGAGTMMLEIGLTRLFSVLLFYHYVFLVLAVALLGLGLGAALVSLLPDRQRRAIDYATGAASLAALATIATPIVSTRLLPVGIPILHGAVALVPFLFVGISMPLLFVARPTASPTIYGADLAGAALGAGAVYGLLFLGAVTAVLGAAICFAVAAWVAGRGLRVGRGSRSGLVALVGLLFVISATVQPIDVDLARLASGKPLGQWLRLGQASVLGTTWDPFGRVDVVRTPNNSTERFVFVDGAAGSALPRYPDDPTQETRRLMELGAFPYRLVDAQRTLVIGSGGGIGVLYAVLNGVADVTAVEVSRGVIDAVRDAGAYDGFLYDRPGVTVVADEGRSFLDRTSNRYDVIDMSLVVSLASAQGGYALTENYLFTQEAFASVVAHLTDQGLAAVRLYDDPTLTRAFVTAASALRQTAESDAEAVRHLVVVFNPNEAERSGGAFYPQLLVSKRPLTESAAKELTARAESLGYTVMFAPFVQETGPFGKIARGEATLESIQSELAGGVFTPPTDARPFFFEMTEGLPREMINAWIVVAVVLTATAAALVGAARSTGAPMSAVRRAGLPLTYFAILGVGFMVVEVALMARLSLLLGHPTTAISVVLAALLLSGGLGSLYSRRIDGKKLGSAITVAGLGAAALTVAVPMLAESARESLAGTPLAVRVAVVVCAIAPLGVALGVLFPSGLRLVPLDPSLPWAVNGVASVVGAVLATTIALTYGYPTTSLTGALLYAGLALMGPALLHQPLPLPAIGRWTRASTRAPVGNTFSIVDE